MAKHHSDPTSIVNLGPTDHDTDRLCDPDYYKSFGLSQRVISCLLEKNKEGHPIPEFYWLDRKWIKYYSKDDKAVQDEIAELCGGYFIQLPLRRQCELLGVPLFEALEAPHDGSTRAKARWRWRDELVPPETYVVNLLRYDFDVAINDEGEHLKTWRTAFSEIFYNNLAKQSGDVFPDDYGTRAQKLRETAAVCRLAREYDEQAFFKIMRKQIKKQVRESWWPNSYPPGATMAAAMTWGQEDILRFALAHQWGAGYPDIMLYKDPRHTLLEVKTTDRLHQSQAHFVRNTRSLNLDIRLVKLVPARENPKVNNTQFKDWISAPR